jgi:hypothetical protein
MSRILIVIFLIGLISGCRSEPPIPKDPKAIEEEIKREKEIRQGLESGKSVTEKEK